LQSLSRNSYLWDVIRSISLREAPHTTGQYSFTAINPRTSRIVGPRDLLARLRIVAPSINPHVLHNPPNWVVEQFNRLSTALHSLPLLLRQSPSAGLLNEPELNHISNTIFYALHTADMSLNEKPTMGAAVVESQPQPKPTYLAIGKPSLDNASAQSLASTVDQSHSPVEEYDPTSSHPFSAFYSHPTTRTSLEQYKSESKVNIKIYEQDLEAGSRIVPSSDISRTKTECTVWPGKRQLIEKRMKMERNRGCNPMRNLSKKQKLWIKILIAMVIVGAAVGLGIGISKATGSGVFKTTNSQTAIGNGKSG